MHAKLSGWGPENAKAVANLKSRVLGQNAAKENAFFSMNLKIREGITDDNDLCGKFTKLFNDVIAKEMLDAAPQLSLKFNNGRLFVRGSLTLPVDNNPMDQWI